MNQLHDFFEFIHCEGLNAKNLEARVDLMDGIKLQRLVEILNQLVHVPYEEHGRHKRAFDFEANADLSGGSDWCSSLMCRLRKVDELARFSALYSDKVFIANPFDKYDDLDSTFYKEPRIHLARRYLVGDILVLLYLKPLFEAGILFVRVNPSHICFDCINKSVDEGSDIRSVLDNLRNELRKIYYQEPKYVFRNEKEYYVCTATGTEHLIEHGEIELRYSKTHHPDLRPIARSLGKKKSKQLSNEELKVVGIVESLLDPVLDGLLVQSFSAKVHGTSYITNKSIEIDLINRTGSKEVANVSTAMLEGFLHSVPNVVSAPLSKLLALRKDQFDAFLVYRDALDKALKEGRNLSIEEMKTLVDDVVRPEINKVSRAINISKKLLGHGLKTDAFIGTGFITIGLFAGLLLPDIKSLVEAVSTGAASVALLDGARRISNARFTEASVAENPYYFLWQAKQVR